MITNICSAMNALAQTPMKGATKCSKHSDLQKSAKQWVVECGNVLGDFPGSRLRHCFFIVYRYLPVLHAHQLAQPL